MSYIAPQFILPQDMVDILDKKTGGVARWHVSDARHAMDVEPDRYVVAGMAAQPVPEAEEIHKDSDRE